RTGIAARLKGPTKIPFEGDVRPNHIVAEHPSRPSFAIAEVNRRVKAVSFVDRAEFVRFELGRVHFESGAPQPMTTADPFELRASKRREAGESGARRIERGVGLIRALKVVRA